jgi:hypothetical protein
VADISDGTAPAAAAVLELAVSVDSAACTSAAAADVLFPAAAAVLDLPAAAAADGTAAAAAAVLELVMWVDGTACTSTSAAAAVPNCCARDWFRKPIAPI